MSVDPQNDFSPGDLQNVILRKILDRLQFSGGGGGGGGGTLSTDVTLGGGSPSNALYPSQRAAKIYIDAGLSTKQNSLGYTPENVANKSNDTTLGADSATLYPTQHAVKAYVTAHSSTPGGADTQVQFNDGGVFGGESTFVYDKTLNRVSVSNVFVTTGVLDIGSGATELLADGTGFIGGWNFDVAQAFKSSNFINQTVLNQDGSASFAGGDAVINTDGSAAFSANQWFFQTNGDLENGGGSISLHADGSGSFANSNVSISNIGDLDIGSGQFVVTASTGQLDWAGASGTLAGDGSISTVAGISLGSGAFAVNSSGLVSTVLAFTGTTNPGLRVNNLTTTQRDAITPGAGTLIYNTTTSRFNFFDSAWRNGWVGIAGDTMSGSLAFSGSTNPGLRLNNLSTTSQNALVASAGTVIWNINTNRIMALNQSAAWEGYAKVGGDTFTGPIVFSGTTNAGIKLSNLTTAQRDALTGAAGMVIWNTDTLTVDRHNGTAWVSLSAPTAATYIVKTAATGTGYTLTATNAKVTFGTISPTITIPAAGTWMIRGYVRVELNAATFAASRVVTSLLRRTNNTPANISTSGIIFNTPIVTTVTQSLAIMPIPEQVYTTANTDDLIEIWADVSTLPTAGTVSIDAAALTAVRIA